MKPLVVCVHRDARGEALARLAAELGLAAPLECHPPDPFGRPRLSAAGQPLAVSFSHCGPLTAIALAREGRVGIDLIDAERSWPGAEDPEGMPHGKRAWACREALLKALGLGLRLPPESILLAPEGPGFRILAMPGGPEGWEFALMPAPGAGAGLTIALAWNEAGAPAGSGHSPIQ